MLPERGSRLATLAVAARALPVCMCDTMHSTPSSVPFRKSALVTRRRPASVAMVGGLGIGGDNPIRIQSMTTSDTQDVAATVAQSIALAEVGCEIVRVTAPNVQAAAALREIRARFSAAGFAHVPLVADIHFLPQAAMEAVEHVEKIRVNPGNYADKKKFALKDYSDADYALELERLHEAFSPLVLRCMELGRCLRIGTNHGSLSDRIMNRYGDSPLGMVESALEFVRICEYHNFHDIVLSMKASNPKVVVQAYRLLVSRMDAAHRPYPLHLGVTEAGDGEDGRIKSAIGIGALLFDGIGDTIRVSLTEDSVHEIPVAQALARKAMQEWSRPVASEPLDEPRLAADPFSYRRRACASLSLGSLNAGPSQAPRVIVFPGAEDNPSLLASRLESPRGKGMEDTPAECIGLRVTDAKQLFALPKTTPAVLLLDLGRDISLGELEKAALPDGTILARCFESNEASLLTEFARFARAKNLGLALGLDAKAARALHPVLNALGSEGLLAFLTPRLNEGNTHLLGAHRALLAELDSLQAPLPLWIRARSETKAQSDSDSVLLDTSILAGALLADGYGDFLSAESEPDHIKSIKLAYNVLQGAGTRISKTEFVACPSCGRTLFDLQATTQRIRAITGHLKGVKIAIMGCIVNGPGEMADADFGYVGGAPGKINLYVGKTCVRFNIPQEQADARLVELIREHGKWTDPR